MSHKQGAARLFIRRFLAAPGTVGAVWPSSPALASKITEAVGLESAASVVEIGPGTGALTHQVLETMSPDARFLAVERDEMMAAHLREKYPHAAIHHACATTLPHLIEDAAMPAPEVVISGLPWAIFPDSLQRELIDSIRDSLTPGGRFATFAYLQGLPMPAGRRFRALLESSFTSVTTSEIVWRNVPPAIVYRCTK